MKIIHCADLHLGSKLMANLTPERAKERGAELVGTFLALIEEAKRTDVRAILIAGDLFDTKNISAFVRNSVRDAIAGNPTLDFYYLKGNHDVDGFLNALPEIPDNLHLFGNAWSSYEIPLDNGKKVVITGVELDPSNSAGIYSSLLLRVEDFNIVTLHGQAGDYKAKDKAESISLGDLKNKNIDYLALGHIHEYHEGDIAPRGTWCYPGCLEGRGFDEYGKHGYVLLDIDEDTLKATRTLHDISKRTVYRMEVDVSSCSSSLEMKDLAEKKIAESGAQKKDYVRIELVGKLSATAEKNVQSIRTLLEEGYYVFELVDNTRFEVDYGTYRGDSTLKGEFVRLLEEEAGLTEDQKAAIIRCGLQALAGEELEL